MNCVICQSPVILYGSKYRCPNCSKMKLNGDDLTNVVGLLHYLYPDKIIEKLVDIIARGNITINRNTITNPNILVLKKGVYRVDIKGDCSKKVFFYTDLNKKG